MMGGLGQVYLVWAAYIVDLVIGDPRCLPHPVVLIGKTISKGESLLRQPGLKPPSLRLRGSVLVAIIVVGTYLVTSGILLAARHLGPVVSAVVWVWFFSTTLATRGLGDAGLSIARPLEADDLETAKKMVSYVVSRDTFAMNENDVARAAVETVAENTSDGIIAPLFYGVIGGPALAMAYKAVNTLDSMLGYKNEKYLHFGWAAAKLDDLANLIPARVTGILLSITSWVMGKGLVKPLKTMARYAKLHPSPNGGYPESAIAGSLEIELGGLNWYHGVQEERARMGVPKRPITARTIRTTVTMMYLTSIFGLILFSFILRR